MILMAYINTYVDIIFSSATTLALECFYISEALKYILGICLFDGVSL